MTILFPLCKISSQSVGKKNKSRKEKGKETRKKEGIFRLLFKGFMQYLNLLHKSGRISINNGPNFNPKKVLESAGR